MSGIPLAISSPIRTRAANIRPAFCAAAGAGGLFPKSPPKFQLNGIWHLGGWTGPDKNLTKNWDSPRFLSLLTSRAERSGLSRSWTSAEAGLPAPRWAQPSSDARPV
jgi:hypothetical protein